MMTSHFVVMTNKFIETINIKSHLHHSMFREVIFANDLCSEGDSIATWGYSGGKWMNVPLKSMVAALAAVARTR